MSTFITPQVQEILHSPAPWPGFAFKVVENPEGIYLLVSLDELAKFSQRQQEDISAWMAGMCNQIRQMQIPCYIQRWDR